MNKNNHYSSTPQGPLVCALIYEQLCTFSFGLVVEAFSPRPPGVENWYRFRSVACGSQTVHASGGLTVHADSTIDALETADLIVLPGWTSPDTPVPDAVKNALIRAHRNGKRIASVCSGVFVLAACGLLDGRNATTHWRNTDQLLKRFPLINVVPDVLYVDNGDILTSAGAAAGIDLCLHIIRNDFGSEVANEVARQFVMPAHREGGQRQYLTRPVPKSRGNRIAELMDKIRMELDQPWSIERMSQTIEMSPRTLSRHMIDTTGQSPQTWLVATKVSRAAELLETSDYTLEQITAACGFGSQESFRRHFRLLIGMSPTEYRSNQNDSRGSKIRV